MECPECGAIALENDLFCGECGAILATLPAVEAAPPPALSPPPALAPEPAFAPASRDGRANTALVLGILSLAAIVLSCVPLVGLLSCLGPPLGIVAAILGAIVQRDVRAKGGLEEDRRRAQQGMILGIAGTVLYVVAIVVLLVLGVGLSAVD